MWNTIQARAHSAIRVLRCDPGFVVLTGAAWALLVIMRGVVRTMTLRRIVRTLGAYLREVPAGEVPPSRHRRIRRIRRAIDKAAPHTPTYSNCYPQALTASLLLRAFRIPSTTYYGARFDDDGELETHVWVCSGPYVVAGGPVHLQFGTVATYAHVPMFSRTSTVRATVTGPG